MSIYGLLQIRAPSSPYEHDIARSWWALPRGCRLPLNDGGAYQLIFPGLPGGPAGPDVRDAVLAVPFSTLADGVRQASATRHVGDVEFHVRASDWFVHRHHTDPRYNSVMLHVVLICDDRRPTLRQDGVVIPVCSLNDLPGAMARPPLVETEKSWPCHLVMQRLSAEARDRLLLHAGLLRYELKAHAFLEQLHMHDLAVSSFGLYDACLIPALAEGLGYGRDRVFFRAIGLRLSRPGQSLPEPLGRAPRPAPLDARRLRVLSLLIQQWQHTGIWQTLRNLLMPPQDMTDSADVLQRLRSAFCSLGLSLARTDIIISNVVLPFATAVALLEQDGVLAERAQACYLLHPGLPSNRITRMMCAQLQLLEEPHGCCRQQGLHYIYQQTCREKRCEVCLMGKNDI